MYRFSISSRVSISRVSKVLKDTVETERQKILVIGKTECLNEELSGYAIQLAQRQRYDKSVVIRN